MCGIFGVINKGTEVDVSKANKALQSMQHRGPDGKAIYQSKNGNALLGHVRLSIIDLNSGAQPISNETNDIHVIVNGELYNYQVIRKELEAKGHIFKTQSDSEIALHLYEEYGEDFVSSLRGEFAIVILDERSNELIAVRDRFGIKPLCYYHTTDELIVSSEAKAIFSYGVKAEWDYEAYLHAATLQYLPTDRTLFKGIMQLQPGHLLKIKNNSLEIYQYWDLNYPMANEEQIVSFEEAKLEFNSLMEESVRLRMQSDVDICCHLSGGLDSSTIAALMSRNLAKQIHCFNVSFDDASYDEQEVAMETATLLGAKLTTINVTRLDMLKVLPEACYFSEGLAINGHFGAKYLLNKKIKDSGYKVALSGEGADEVLLGYAHLRSEIKSLNLNSLVEGNSLSDSIMIANSHCPKVSEFENRLNYTPNFIQAKISYGIRLQEVMDHSFVASQPKENVYSSFLNSLPSIDRLSGRESVYKSCYLWSKYALSNYILKTLGDGMEMANSVEGRVPFLDHKLVEYVNKLPLNYKINNGVEKYILREAMKPLLTERVYNRQKHPFIAPPLSATKIKTDREYMSCLQDILRSKSFDRVPFFDRKQIRKFLDSMPKFNSIEQRQSDPVLMTALTSYYIGEGFNL